MVENDVIDDDLRPEYDLSQLEGGVRGKYSERYSRGSTNLLAAAVLCGTIPLTFGTLIYFTWRATRWSWLPGAGLLTILWGLLLFVVGLICLAKYVARESRVERPRRVPLGHQAMLVAGLLVANFPVAAFYAGSAIDLMSRFMVQIINESGNTIDSFVLIGPGVNVEAGPISPADRAQCSLEFLGDGKLDFAAIQRDYQFNGRLADYVTVGWGTEITVRVKPEGKFEVTGNNSFRD
jgi:hypothetical protein